MITETKRTWKVRTSETLPTHRNITIHEFADGVMQVRAKSGKRSDVLEWHFSKKRFKTIADIERYILSLITEIMPQLAANQYNNRIRWIIQLILTWIIQVASKLEIVKEVEQDE